MPAHKLNAVSGLGRRVPTFRLYAVPGDGRRVASSGLPAIPWNLKLKPAKLKDVPLDNEF
ncbi:MAG: hypothetical protein JRF30_01175 [Deltaproteobacteria bacterium]|nr:hypothetical protein [Deltaproteobacteria bacterium]MBW1793055.1 hypothetical protein [Deltaproteobacteria bacterium]MBW2329563.1 hypothetical protein [Deltaproteobacteria bacterium]